MYVLDFKLKFEEKQKRRFDQAKKKSSQSCSEFFKMASPRGRVRYHSYLQRHQLSHKVTPLVDGDRVAFVPPGTPGPYRVHLGFKKVQNQ